MKLLWSSRSQKFIGHAMTHAEMSSLSDVYAALSPDYKLKHCGVDFDVIGPHFTNDGAFAHEFLYSYGVPAPVSCLWLLLLSVMELLG